MPKNIKTEFIDIKAEGTPDSAALENDDNEELHSVISSLHEYGGVDEKCATASKSESCTPGSTLRPASSRDSLVHSPITSSCYHR
ncbi:hypothetical protein L798_11032 [Zootermopsis nevadensis]|uniref:Uncharacterized protein n=1 Tax=Zootermopsis nevadensis TaxID=136037 RepID=A0A067RIZ3_ZOONE|nr:hypothetical protein L798_11032 [Zootermopsis nevadensis]